MADSRPRRVVIAEDDPDIRESLAELLRIEGWSVWEARNGRDALDLVKGVEPDVLLLDLMMPVMDGWEVLDKLREAGPQPFGVIVLSASLEAETLSRELCVMSKPFALDHLLDAMEREAAGKGSFLPH